MRGSSLRHVARQAALGWPGGVGGGSARTPFLVQLFQVVESAVALLAVGADGGGHEASVGGQDRVGGVGLAGVVVCLFVLLDLPLSSSVHEEQGDPTEDEQSRANGNAHDGAGGQ